MQLAIAALTAAELSITISGNVDIYVKCRTRLAPSYFSSHLLFYRLYAGSGTCSRPFLAFKDA